jgi:hypothetical protein
MDVANYMADEAAGHEHPRAGGLAVSRISSMAITGTSGMCVRCAGLLE